MRHLTVEIIRDKLRSEKAQVTADVPGLFDKESLRTAAVLIIFKPRNDGLSIVLTKRAASMRNHAGQIAFPGGAKDPQDATYPDCALREAQEEIGFSPQSAEVLGMLAPHLTISDFRVTPVVCWDHSADVYRPSSGEVDYAFEVPVEHALNLRKFRHKERIYKGAPRKYLTIPFGPFYVWGATARMLQSLALVLCDE